MKKKKKEYKMYWKINLKKKDIKIRKMSRKVRPSEKLRSYSPLFYFQPTTTTLTTATTKLICKRQMKFYFGTSCTIRSESSYSSWLPLHDVVLLFQLQCKFTNPTTTSNLTSKNTMYLDITWFILYTYFKADQNNYICIQCSMFGVY